jgi:hypothetical protein
MIRFVPMQLKRRGLETRLIIPEETIITPRSARPFISRIDLYRKAIFHPHG